MGRSAKKARTKPVSVYLPQELADAFNQLVAEAQNQIGPGAKMSESGYIVALIVRDLEAKGSKRKR